MFTKQLIWFPAPWSSTSGPGLGWRVAAVLGPGAGLGKRTSHSGDSPPPCVHFCRPWPRCRLVGGGTPSSAHQGLAPGGADAAAPSEGGESGSCSLGGLDVQHEEDGQSLAPGSGHLGSPLPGLQGRGTEGAGDATRGTGRSGCAGRPPAAQNEAAVRWEGGPRLPSVTGRPAAARVGTVLCHLAPCVPQGDLARGLVAFWGRGVLCPGGAGAGGAGKPERERVPAGVTRLTAGFSIPCP